MFKNENNRWPQSDQFWFSSPRTRQATDHPDARHPGHVVQHRQEEQGLPQAHEGRRGEGEGEKQDGPNPGRELERGEGSFELFLPLLFS